MNFAARLKEPSTWAAMAAGLAALGVNIPPGIWQGVVGVGTGIAMLAGILIAEKGSA